MTKQTDWQCKTVAIDPNISAHIDRNNFLRHYGMAGEELLAAERKEERQKVLAEFDAFIGMNYPKIDRKK